VNSSTVALRIEEHALHLFKALVVAVHQSIVEDDRGRAAGSLASLHRPDG
jgi:hypothetical protein